MAKDRLFKTTLIYFIGTLATRLLNVLMIRVYTHTIPADPMGYFKLAFSNMAVIVPALLFMIWDVYLRFGVDSKTAEERRRLTSNVLITTGVLMPIYLVTFLTVGSFLHLDYLWPMALMALTWPLASIWQSGMRIAGKNKLYAVAGITGTVVNIAVSLLFIFPLKLPVLSQYISVAASMLTIFLIAEPNIHLFPQVKIKSFDWTLQKKMLRFGGPLIANSVAYYFISAVGGVIITYFIGDAANGIFSVASSFSMVVATVTQIFYLAWQEEAFREAKSEKLQSYMANVLKMYMRVLFAGVCFGLPLLKVVAYPLLVEKDFFASWVYLPAVIMTAVYSALSTFCGSSFGAGKKTGGVMVSTAVGAVLSFLISILGVRRFGIHAVAIAACVGFLVTFLMRVYLSKRVMEIHVHWPVFIALNAAVGIVVFVFYIDSLWLQLAASAAGLALFVVLNRKIIVWTWKRIYRRLRRGRTLPPVDGLPQAPVGRA